MKKTYETPVLTTEPFDADDVIAVSSANAATVNNSHSSIWEVSDIPTDVQFT